MAMTRKLKSIADAQLGFFTTAQAVAAGYSSQLQSYHVSQGHWLKIDRGVFRLPGYLPEETCHEAALIRWNLWLIGGKDKSVTISHDSALFEHGLSTTRPDVIHLSVPSKQWCKQEKEGCHLHRQELEPGQIIRRAGYSITTPLKTLQDMKPDLLLQKRWTQTVNLAHDKAMITTGDTNRLLAQTICATEGRAPMHSESYTADPNGYRAAPAMPVAQTGRTTAYSSLPVPNGLSSQTLQGSQSAEPDNTGKRVGRLIRKVGITGSQQAFTLVELLVVVAIIGILASFLMPAMHKALQLSKQSSCLNNEKQLGLAMSTYLNDYRGWYPGAWDFNASGLAISPTWGEKLCPYLGIEIKTGVRVYTKMFDCPGDTREINDHDDHRAAPNSYGMNSVRINNGAIIDGIFIDNGTWNSYSSSTTTLGNYLGSVHESWVPKPSATMVVVDGTNGSTYKKYSFRAAWAPAQNRGFWYGTYQMTLQPHGNESLNNYLFCDGHAAAYTPQASVGTGNISGAYPGYRGIWSKIPND